MLHHDFEQSIGYWSCLTSRALERSMNEELAPHGITYPQCQVLCWLALEGELSQSQLADRMRVEPPTLAGILDRMERDGWISREAAPHDRRRKIVRPAARVQPIWDTIMACIRRVRARATHGIDPDEVERARLVLVAISQNLNTPELVGETVP